MGRTASSKMKAPTAKARVASETDKRNAVVECNCGLCYEAVKDEEDEGLYCEGTCAQWFHRYCAGVTAPQFERLSNSSSPFLCYACFQEEHRTKVLSLEDKVAALTTQLCEIKTILEGRRELQLQSWTDVVKRGRSHPRNSGNANGQKSRSIPMQSALLLACSKTS